MTTNYLQAPFKHTDTALVAVLGLPATHAEAMTNRRKPEVIHSSLAILWPLLNFGRPASYGLQLRARSKK